MLNITVHFPQIATIIECAENVTLKYRYSYLQQYKCVQHCDVNTNLHICTRETNH